MDPAVRSSSPCRASVTSDCVSVGVCLSGQGQEKLPILPQLQLVPPAGHCGLFAVLWTIHRLARQHWVLGMLGHTASTRNPGMWPDGG